MRGLPPSKGARRIAGALLAAAALAAAAFATPTEPAPADSDRRIERAVALVGPSLVRLTVISLQYSDGRAQRYPSSGSGVVVSPDGHVLTNYHVAGRSARIRATLADGSIVDAEVVAHDPLTDLSVLELKIEPGARLPPAARFAEEAPRVGQEVLALGNPLTLASSVTLGIVSNTRRVFTDFVGTQIEDLDLDGEPTGLFTLWIQHDALILPGNSGGPLIDLEGRIVGINELGGSGVGFAIPGEIARSVLAASLADGRVRRSDLGFGILPVARLGRERGALVSSVTPASPAERAGLQPGDIVLELAGEAVEVRFFEQVPEFYRAISELEIGGEVELLIEREGRTLALRPATVEREPAAGLEAEVPEFGITVQEVTPAMARRRRLGSVSGLLVTSLRAGQPAAESRPPLAAGDLLTRVDGVATASIATLNRVLAGDHARESLLLELTRDGRQMLSVTRPANGRSLRAGGELPKAWLGVETQVVTAALARAMGRPDLRGFRISSVLPGSGAAAAGLETGDVIVAIDGEPLEAERDQDADNLRREIEERAIGDRVLLALADAAHRPVEVAVDLLARPAGAGEAPTARDDQLGFAARGITLFDRVEFRWHPDQQGVLVTEVVPGGWAQMAGLSADDLITEVDGQEVASIAALEAVLGRVRESRPEVVRLFVDRGSRTHYVFLEPDWDGSDAAGDDAGEESR